MTAAAVLARAHAAGLTVEAMDGRLRWRGPPPPTDLLAALRANKAELLTLLTTAPRYTVTVPDAGKRQNGKGASANAPHGAFCGPMADPLPAEIPPPDAPALLSYLRETLHCDVWLDRETVRIGPTHRCPPRPLAAALAVLPALRNILEGEHEAV